MHALNSIEYMPRCTTQNKVITIVKKAESETAKFTEEVFGRPVLEHGGWIATI